MVRAFALACAILVLPAAARAECLAYNPHEVVLEGRLEARVGTSRVAGEPGRIDQVSYYAVVLDLPTCTKGVGRGLLRPEQGLRAFQLTLREPGVVDRTLLGSRVRVVGQLHHRRASRQYTPVLIHARTVTAVAI